MVTGLLCLKTYFNVSAEDSLEIFYGDTGNSSMSCVILIFCLSDDYGGRYSVSKTPRV